MGKCGSKTKLLPAMVAWSLLLSLTTLYFYYPCLQYYVFQLDQWWLLGVHLLLAFFLLVNFCLATFLDPGVIPRASPDEDRDDDYRAPLYRNVEINGVTVRMKWCLTCQFYRPPRCSHCSVCNVCIEVFDHHCPWVNNCIGRRNYRYFYLFLISLSIHMMSAFILCLIHLINKRDEISELPVIISIVTMVVIALLIIPVLGLTGFHTVLVARGRTTNEQVTGKFRGGFNPYSKGCWINCCYALCGPNFPSLRHPSRYVGRTPRRYTIPARPMLIQNQVMVNNNSNIGNRRHGNSGGKSGGNINGNNSATGGAMAVVGGQPNNLQQLMLSPEDGSDLDEPMGSQSIDVEAPLTHNTSKSNFFEDQSTTNLLSSNRTSIKGQNQTSSPSPNFQPPKYPTMIASKGIRGLESVELRPLSSSASSSSSRFPSSSYANHTMATASSRRGTTSRPDHISIENSRQGSRPVIVQGSKRYGSDGELLDRSSETSPQQSFYIWNEPPGNLPPGAGAAATSPQRHASYASQVGYFLHQQQQPPALQSGGPRTTPSGYPGGPVVPSGSHRGYTTTGRSSVHQQPTATTTVMTTTTGPSSSSSHPLSFTRALEVSESLNEGRRENEEEANRESVYDLNNYEISV